jgi:hypothetical protein
VSMFQIPSIFVLLPCHDTLYHASLFRATNRGFKRFDGLLTP